MGMGWDWRRDCHWSWAAAASPPRVPETEESLHECMPGKRADTPRYVEEGRGQLGGGQERGAEMCSLAVAEDLHPQSHQPLTLGRETSSEQPSGHRGCCKMCQGIPELYLGEETEKSR